MQMQVLVKIFGRIFVGRIFVATAGRISVVKSPPETYIYIGKGGLVHKVICIYIYIYIGKGGVI